MPNQRLVLAFRWPPACWAVPCLAPCRCLSWRNPGGTKSRRAIAEGRDERRSSESPRTLPGPDDQGDTPWNHEGEGQRQKKSRVRASQPRGIKRRRELGRQDLQKE